MRSSLVPLLLAAALCAGCRDHVLNPGAYAFTWTAVQLDDCGLYTATSAIGTGSLTHAGDDVWIDFQPFTINLRGEYRDKEESFYVDGTAGNVATTVDGHACQLDMAQYHFDGDTQSAQEFTGGARVTYTSIDDFACRCQARGEYQAVLQSP